MKSIGLGKVIGIPALMEGTAEECSELAQAALKYARKLREENPTEKTKEEIIRSLNEEIADVMICVDELLEANVISHSSLESSMLVKRARVEARIEAMQESK